MYAWIAEAANAAGWRVVCHGVQSVVLKSRLRGGWDARVIVVCRCGEAVVEGHMQRSRALSPRLAGRRQVFCETTKDRGGPWLYWLLHTHFGTDQAMAAPPMPTRGMPLPAPLFTRAAMMVSRDRVSVDFIQPGLWRVVAGNGVVYMQLCKREAVACGIGVLARRELDAAYDACRTPPWTGHIDSAGLALWAFNVLRHATTRHYSGEFNGAT